MDYLNSIIFLIASILFILFGFLVFRVIVRRDYQKNGRLSWLTTFLQVLVFFLHANLAYLFLPAKWLSLPPLSGVRILNITGLSLIGLALIFITLSMGALGYPKTMGVNLNHLKETGFYRFSRNPQIIFYNFLLIGFALLWPSWYAIPWILVYYIIAHMMVLTEEENLRRTFGKSFEEYCRRVPRYFLFH